MARLHLRGLPASPGVAVGPAWWHRAHPDTAASPAPGSPDEERARLRAALARAQRELEALVEEQRDRIPPEERAIFQAQQLMLADPEILQRVEAAIAEGTRAEEAWRAALEAVAEQLAALPDPTLQARAADVRDVMQRVLRALRGEGGGIDLPAHPVVLLAEELLPSETATLTAERVLAVVTAGGGPTAHAAILARRLGIPAVVAVGAPLHQVENEQLLVVDGDAGEVLVDPSPDERAQAERARRHALEARATAQATAAAPAVTRDGRAIEVAANIGSLADVQEALAAGADGVGLLRTEFLFLGRSTEPDEEEQVATYRALLEPFGGRLVVVRTLDIGGDKPLPYVPMPAEPNPFLGVRGVRLARQYPDLLRVQLRALLRTGYPGLRIMFPMVTTVEEMRWLRGVVDDVTREVGTIPALQVGMMVEVPAAALLADRFVPWVDFFSIGTNDLAQYTLAADRTNAAVAALADAAHPAVLELVRRVVEAARPAGRWVGVCGELAGEALLTPVLIGLGVDELSMAPVAIPDVKAVVRAWSLADARALAEAALALDSATAVRELARQAAASRPQAEGTG